MTNFKDREHGFEAKFAMDEELKFRATARRNGLLGHWASQKLGLSNAAADAYAKELVRISLDDADAEAIFKKIRADFDAHGISQSDHQIRRTMDEFLTRAMADLKAGD